MKTVFCAIALCIAMFWCAVTRSALYDTRQQLVQANTEIHNLKAKLYPLDGLCEPKECLSCHEAGSVKIKCHLIPEK